MPGATPLMYNPRSADGGGARVAARAKTLLEARGIDVELHQTREPGGGRTLASELAAAGARRILVLGGDGTLSEAADGILGLGKDVTLGFLPGGTANDFLRDFDMRDLERAVARIAEGETRSIDAAVVQHEGGSRHFITIFGTGFMAHVCDYANRRLKWMGSKSYKVAVFAELARLKRPPTRLTLDGEELDERLALVAVCNTKHAGGAMQFAPMARTDDGLLEVIALRDVGRMRLVRLFPKLFDGSHVGNPDVLHARAREITIEPAIPSPLLGDGEVYGSTPVTVRVLPAALRLLM